MVRKFHLTLMLALLASQAIFVNFANAATGDDLDHYGESLEVDGNDLYADDNAVAFGIMDGQTVGGPSNDDDEKMAVEPKQQNNQESEEEEEGGLEDDDEILTLTTGGKTFDISKKDALLSKFVTTIRDGDEDATYIKVSQVPAETMAHVIDYLRHHKGQEPDQLPCPVRSIHMGDIVSDKWDAKDFIDTFDKKTIFEIILAANYMDIKSLLHLGCAKVATLIKQLDQKEINKIIQDEEKYRREHAANDAANDAVNDEEAKYENKDE
eukprot:291850_1